MNQHSVRIPPLNPEDFNEEQKAAVGEWGVLNFSRVLAHHPALYRVFVPYIEKVISYTDLSPRDREVICLRVLSRCGEHYEFGHHVDIARDKVGMTDADIDAVMHRGDTLSAREQLLINACDELVQDFCISENTWQALAEQYSTVELMEVVGLVGCYTTMAMLTRSFGIQPESRGEVEKQLAALRTYD